MTGVAADLQELFEAKTRSELAQADALLAGAQRVTWHGHVLARTILLKGVPDPADVQAGYALAGEDGVAARKALGALRLDVASVLGGCTRTSIEDEPGDVSARLTLAIEAVDPSLIVALDDRAAGDLCATAGLEHLVVGEPVTVHGRTLLAVGDLTASLSDEALKREVWDAFRTLAHRS